MDRYVSRFLLFVSLFLGGASLYALPLGNPMEPSLYLNDCVGQPFCGCLDQFSLRVGYSADHVFNRHLEVTGRAPNRMIASTVLDTNSGFIALNWCDRVDLFSRLGATSIRLNTPNSAFTVFNALGNFDLDCHIQSQTDFSWSLGLRATVVRFCNAILGVEGEYFRTSPPLDYLHQENQNIAYGTGSQMSYEEWQVGAGLAYPLCYRSSFDCIPYVGVKVSYATLDMDDATFTLSPNGSRFVLFDAESKLRWGFPIGVSLVLCNMIGVSVEGRFGDEQAIYVNGQFRF